MRFIGVLFFIGVLGVLGYSSVSYLVSNQKDIALETIGLDRISFSNQHKAASEITFDVATLNPDLVLPKSFDYSYPEISRFDQATQSCEFENLKIKDARLRKAVRYHAWLCGQEDEPGETFFSEEPRYHPLGGTYAARSVEKKSGDLDWTKKQIPNFHASELKGLDQNLLTESQWRLSRLSLDELGRLYGRDNIVLTTETVWLRVDENETGLATYELHSRPTWDSYFSSRPWVFVGTPTNKTICAAHEGRGCWERNEKYRARPTKVLIISLVVALFGLLIVLFAVIVRWMRSRSVAMQSRRFVLQMLTHELRTPASSLKLDLENLRPGFDKLSPDQQDAFLRMCNDLQRFDQIIESSTAYLKVEQGPDLRLRLVEIPSINEFAKKILEEEARRVDLHLLKTDQNLKTDPYWLALCIRNLVRNAFDHGVAPVSVNLKLEERTLIIEVSDTGQTSFKLEDLTKPFEKNDRSRGLGLGLSLVQQLVKKMGGTLTYSGAPTTFGIRLELK